MLIDRGANTDVRQRRALQHAADAPPVDGISIVKTSAGTMAINPQASGGLSISGTGVTILLSDTSLQLAVGGLSARLAANSGLQVSTGLLLKLADGSLQLAAGGVSVKLVDTSLATAVGGLGVNLATGGGLIVSSGLVVNSFQVVASDLVSPTAGASWYNSATFLVKSNLASVSGNNLPAALVGCFFFGSGSSAVSGTTAKTFFTPNVTIPAGAFNKLGRTIRVTGIVGSSAVGAETITITLNWGAVAIWTITVNANIASNLWIDLLITCSATGSTGQFLVLGRVFNASTVLTAANVATTVNLTVATAMAWAGQFSAVSGSDQVQMSYWSFELLG